MSGPGRPLVLVVLVALAGCGGFASDGARTPAETVTPAPVPTAEPTPTPEPEQLAPGLTGDEVTPFELAGAHAGALRNASYSLYHNRTVLANGSVQRQRITTGEFGARYRNYETVVVRRGVGRTEHRAVYSYDGRRVTRETTRGNDSTFRIVMDGRGVGAAPADPLEVLPFNPDFAARIAGLLRAAEPVSVDPEAPRVLSADTLYRVRATGFRSGPRGRSVENASFSALVDPDGIVRSYELQYEGVRNGTRVTVIERLRYANVVGYDGPVRDASR